MLLRVLLLALLSRSNLKLKQQTVYIKRTHDLKFLLELCIEENESFKELEVGNLTSYAVEIRYPDGFYIPAIDEGKECSEIASKIKDFVFEKLKYSLVIPSLINTIK